MRPLSLVCAPAGFGKTTLLISWLQQRDMPVAWLSLDDNDSEQDKQSFIRAFAGDDRYIIDYLTDEVLQRQSQEIKQFLLQTSVLDRLCGPLCDKLTGSTGSVERLAMLESLNMFIIPLDSKRRWYRYHHLFADLLRNQLAQQYPDSGQQLHRAASEWFSKNNFPHEAVHHAFEVEDFEQVANVESTPERVCLMVSIALI